MTNRIGTLWLALCGAGAWLCVLGFSGPESTVSTAIAQEAPTEGEGDYETLAAGVVHEAFAEPVLYDPEAGEIVAKEPPEPIEELPPDTKPEGDNVVWIPGYWNWDDDRDNFVWISGFWRDIPPEREWVPGYWTKAPDGWQWVAGYWSGTEEDEVDYLPAAPPATLETGPTTPAPSSDYVWVPGCWMWRDVRYAWRPGYWVVARPNWIWVPAHYVWTPGGFVFVSGYWDMPVPRRGLLFAPVFFRGPVYARPAFRYSPSVVVNVSLFTNHLWVRPRMGCYYFGDYYNARYVDRGFYPWHKFHSGHHGYDPIYVQQYHQHVHIEKNREWAVSLQNNYARHVEVVDSRPSRTFSHLAVAGSAGVAAGAGVASLGLVSSLNNVRQAKDLPVKLQKIDDDRRQQFVQKTKETREFTREREKIEAVAGEGRQIPRHRPGRPDRDGPAPKLDDTGKVVKGPGPKIEGPKPPDAKVDDTGKPAAEQTVKKVGRPRSPVGDKLDKNATAKRDVPPRLDPPGKGSTGIGAKPDLGNPADSGREKVGPTIVGKPKRGGGGDDDGKPDVPPRDTTPKGKGRDMPRDDGPAGKPKFELPKPTPKPAPKVDVPKPDAPRTTPRTIPKPETPRNPPKVDPPKRTETPRNPPPRGRTEPSGGNQPRNEPKNEPRNKGRNDNKGKDRASTGPGAQDGERNAAARSGPARVVDTTPAPTRVQRAEARNEPRNERNVAPAATRSERPTPRAPLASDARRPGRAGRDNDNDDDKRKDRKP